MMYRGGITIVSNSLNDFSNIEDAFAKKSERLFPRSIGYRFTLVATSREVVFFKLTIRFKFFLDCYY